VSRYLNVFNPVSFTKLVAEKLYNNGKGLTNAEVTGRTADIEVDANGRKVMRTGGQKTLYSWDSDLSNCFWYFVSRPGKCLSKSSNIFSKIFVFMTPGSPMAEKSCVQVDRKRFTVGTVTKEKSPKELKRLVF
jgi:hypothetical protein